MRWLMSFTLLMAMLVAAYAQDAAEKPARIQIGLSADTVEISSNFTGTDIVIFGSIEGGDPEVLSKGGYDVVVVLVGPNEEVVVRRKERRMGIWVNGASVQFSDVPASYSVATTRPLGQITDADDVKILQLGLENLSVVAQAGNADVPTEEFRQSLKRIKVDKKLFLERIGGVEFLSPTLFKARLAVPASVPIGRHTARAFLFKDGKFVNSQFAEMRVQKIGFEEFTYQLAQTNGLLYGIIAVLIAIATGWLASVVFSKD